MSSPNRDDTQAKSSCSGPWSTQQVGEFLRSAKIPVRLACYGSSGFPVLASLWFVEREGSLWCATQRGADVVSHISRDPRCAFEVSVERAPYCGVRGQAIASVHEEGGETLLRELIGRYLDDPSSDFAASLLRRADREVAIEITPRVCVSWDFRERMGAAS